MEFGESSDGYEYVKEYMETVNEEIYNEVNEESEKEGNNTLPLAALLLAGVTVLSLEAFDLKKVKKTVFKGKGIWVKKSDRKKILSIINANSQKKYKFNKFGYLVPVKDSKIDTTKSEALTKLIDKLINADRNTVIGFSDIIKKFDNEGNTYEEAVNGGISVGTKDTNQVVILSDKIKDNKEKAVILAHELSHSIEGLSKKANGSENFATKIENKVRKELGLSPVAISENKVAHLYDEYDEKLTDLITEYGAELADWNGRTSTAIVKYNGRYYEFTKGIIGVYISSIGKMMVDRNYFKSKLGIYNQPYNPEPPPSYTPIFPQSIVPAYIPPPSYTTISATVNGRNIRNVELKSTGIYGNLTDITGALGGSVQWNSYSYYNKLEYSLVP
jgi:hypothetical protein